MNDKISSEEEGLSASDEFFMQVSGDLMTAYLAALDETVRLHFGEPKGILAALAPTSTDEENHKMSDDKIRWPTIMTAKVRCVNEGCSERDVERAITFPHLGEGIFHVPTTIAMFGVSVPNMACGTCQTQRRAP